MQLGAGIEWEPLRPGEPPFERKLDASLSGTVARMRTSVPAYDDVAATKCAAAAEALKSVQLGLAADISPVVDLVRWVRSNGDSFLAGHLGTVLAQIERYRTPSGAYVRPGAATVTNLPVPEPEPPRTTTRSDYGGNVDGRPVYVGEARADADPAERVWTIQHIDYDEWGREVGRTTAVGAWDERRFLFGGEIS